MPPERVAQIRLETPLVKGLDLDSLAQAVLLAQIEEGYGILLDLADRERLQTAETVRDLAQIILSCVQK